MTDKQNPIPRFYTVKQVADQLDVNQKSIRRWIDAGVLHFYKFQGRLRISEEDFLAYVSSCRR